MLPSLSLSLLLQRTPRGGPLREGLHLDAAVVGVVERRVELRVLGAQQREDPRPQHRLPVVAVLALPRDDRQVIGAAAIIAATAATTAATTTANAIRARR